MTTNGRIAQRFAIIGDEALTIECAELARDRGLDVAAIVTTNAGLADLISMAGVTIETVEQHDCDDSIVAALGVDLTIVVAERWPLSTDVAARLGRHVVFTDGPVRGRRHATSAGIAAGASSHCVAWHLVDPVSASPESVVIASSVFAIETDETAYSLDARCFEKGLDTFAEVLDVLTGVRPAADGTALATMVDDDGARGDARPLSWIDPLLSAESIERLHRAVDTGNHADDRTGVTRLVLGNEYVVAGTVTVEPHDPATRPGELVGALDGILRVATVNGVVALGELRSPDGAPIELTGLASRHGLRAGDELSGPSPELVQALGELDHELELAEDWWRGEFRPPTPADLSGLFGPVGSGWRFRELAVDRPVSANAAATALVAWLAGSCDGVAEFAMTDAAARTTIRRLIPLARAGVISVHVELDTSMADLASHVATRVDEVCARGPFLADLVGRTQGAPVVPEPAVTLDLGVTADDEIPVTSGVARLRLHDDGRLELAHRLGDEAGQRVAAQLEQIMRTVEAAPQLPFGEVALLGERDRAVLTAVNQTELDHERAVTIDELVARRAARSPDAPAVSSGDRTVTYAGLAAHADQIARRLHDAGVRPGDTVGIALPRSIEMVAAVLAVLDRGAHYLPLDPDYPIDRLRFMVQDSGSQVLVTSDAMAKRLAGNRATAVSARADDDGVTSDHGDPLAAPGHTPDDLAYVIYTSGSTGVPKGVQLEHRQVVNFFAAMDAAIEHDEPGVWLAVTSLSFDISVLELLWTLTRGFHVVLAGAAGAGGGTTRRTATLSLFYFAAGQSQATDGYRLVLESARWADRHGFEAVWTPERHFHDFGAPYPNPSVMGAALAVATERIAIRAGSVVLPLHSPVRVAEEWAVVDNLSNGRVGVSFASGWQPNDFVLNPNGFASAKDALPAAIETVQRLWRGESVDLPGPDGATIAVHTRPRPVQPELPVWLTSAGSPSTFERAGVLGVAVLTHLLGQSIEQLAANLERYRSAWRDAGHPGEGHVTLMLHTFLDASTERARDTAREPLKAYLATAVGLFKDLASAFPVFANSGADADEVFRSLTPAEMDELLDMAADRYLEMSGLFGTVDDAVAMARQAVEAGVDEIACLIDFGIDSDVVLASLDLLDEVRRRVAIEAVRPGPPAETTAGLIEHHGVTHLQCTPSFASMLAADTDDSAALARLRHLLVGGEAMPTALARELRGLLTGRLTNMYGPTETTIWSLVHEVTDVGDGAIPIGAPIGNTTIAILDEHGRELPVGVYGELHIGGEGVARGYHDRAELTAERFVDRPGRGRMYATGDVARVHPAGYVEFGGRSDNQVKIRGHRIELGEIETVLDAHPDVARAVVTATADDLPELVAYVLARADRTPEPAALRSHVASVLPDVMVPSAVVMLDELPLTPNGKIDRKRLPDPHATSPRIGAASTGTTFTDAAPTDAAPTDTPPGDAPGPMPASDDNTLATVAKVWHDHLGRDVGIDENFFDVGGHSLLAIKVFRQLKALTGAPLSLTDVFRFPTIRMFAGYLAARMEPAGPGVAPSSNGAGPDERTSGDDTGRAADAVRRGAMRRRVRTDRGARS